MRPYSQVDGAALLEAARNLEPLVRSLSSQFDRDRQLPHELVAAIADAELFSMWLPQAIGGPELPPIPFLEVIEELSRQEGSVGWCTVIPAGYARLAGALAPEIATEIFGSGRGVLVGTLNPTGKAVAVPGGYRVSGRWSYGSFIAHSHWVLGNCITYDGDEPRRPGGAPELRLCIFPRADTTVFDVWHVGGLRATGSNDYAVNDLFVPREMTMPLVGFSPPPVQPGPLYAMPMPTVFGACIAIVALGIARAAIQALMEIATAKTPTGSTSVLCEKPLTQIDLARAEASLRSGRAFMFDELGTCWDDAVAGRPITLKRRAGVRLAVCQATQGAIQAVDLMYACGGGTSLLESNRLERCFRDVHAAGQHLGVAAATNLEPIGRVLFDLDPGTARF
jgi:alkylation response protein AidB-like acyl-CoA dehydrogenase